MKHERDMNQSDQEMPIQPKNKVKTQTSGQEKMPAVIINLRIRSTVINPIAF
jgi:hypothetical protein